MYMYSVGFDLALTKAWGRSQPKGSLYRVSSIIIMCHHRFMFPKGSASRSTDSIMFMTPTLWGRVLPWQVDSFFSGVEASSDFHVIAYMFLL